MYQEGEFFYLFLVLLKKMRTLVESKVSVVNQGNEGGSRTFSYVTPGVREPPISLFASEMAYFVSD